MPAAPRPKGKAEKIFLKVMGKPKNTIDSKKRKNSRIERKLVFEDTSLAR